MEWEQCKENVKPKREGRTVSNITTPLKGNAAIAEIQERQAEFEREIKEYEGDDELEVWERYVRYMDNAYPEGEWHSNVCTIQFRLARKFMNVDKYKNDIRLLNTFIDFANHAHDAIQVYGFCYYHKIGTRFPSLWTNWVNAFIYRGLLEKALKLVNKALIIFPNYQPIKGLRLEVIKLITKTDYEPTAPVVRSVGSTLGGDCSQAQLPGPRQALNQTLGQAFNVMKDKELHTTHIPSTSCNPLERTRLNKENVGQAPQRWKNCAVHTDNPRAEQPGVKFNVFEEEKGESMSTGIISHRQTTALTAKKVTQQIKSVELFEQGVNSNTRRMETVAYSKSAVYPRDGGEWSFEELWARHRYLKCEEENSSVRSIVDESLEDSRTECRKRSSSPEMDSSESKKQHKETSINEKTPLAETSINSKMPLKSCLTPRANLLLPSNFSLDFAPENTISSSTRKVQVEEFQKNQESLNDAPFSDSPVMKPVRPKLSETTQDRAPFQFHQQSTWGSSDECAASVDSAVPHIISQNVMDSIANDDFFDGLDHDPNQQCTEQQFTLNNLENTLSMGDKNPDFDVFEDPTMQRKVQNVVKQKFGLSSRKKLLVESFDLPHEESKQEEDEDTGLNIFSDGEKSDTSKRNAPEPEFEIFEDERSSKPDELSKSKTGFSIYSGISKNSKPSRESLAFDIFSDDPDPTSDYHLKTIIKTPCADKSSSMGSVPWTWGKINDNKNVIPKETTKDDTAHIREYTKSNTMKINQQALGVLNGDPESDSSIMEDMHVQSVLVNPKPILKEPSLPPKKCDRQPKSKVCFEEPPPSHNMLTDKSMGIPRTSGSETATMPMGPIQQDQFPANSDRSGYQDDYINDPSLEKSIFDGVSGSVIHQLSTLEEQPSIISESIDLRYRTLNNDIDVDVKKQLTPILEGSMDSHMSSNSSSKGNDSEFGPSKSMVELNSYTTSLQNISSFHPKEANISVTTKNSPTTFSSMSTISNLASLHDIPESTLVMSQKPHRKSDEKTTNHFAHPSITMNQTKPLYPDKTHRDVFCDPSCLKTVPKYSTALKEPVSNPYDQDLINNIIQSLDPPLFYRPCFHKYDEDLKWMMPVTLGKMDITNITCIGEGAFAKVYKGDCHGDSNKIFDRAFKVQSPACPWEFYILSEVSERMNKKNNTSCEVTDMILTGLSMHIYNNVSVLVTPCFMEGSLLDMTNIYRMCSPRAHVPEVVILTYALDMLRCVQALHNIGIIHGDIKPDNWLLRDKENTMNSMSMMYTKSVVLIDFGRSIDMKLMPTGSLFTTSCDTDLFECVEMQTHRPWTYQIDYYGILACIYLLFHNDYMKVYFDKNNKKWRPSCQPPRRVNKDLFEKMFSELLNIRNCESIPPLDEYICNLQNYLTSIHAAERHKQLKYHYNFISRSSRK